MRLAATPPAFCASCFQHYSDERFVDFEAAYDGPVIPGSPEPQPVDDLIICERCLADAFAKLDFAGEGDENARLAALLEQASAEIEAKDRMIGRLERTLNEIVEHPITRRAGSGAWAGVDGEIKRLLAERMAKRKKGQEANKPKAKVSDGS